MNFQPFPTIYTIEPFCENFLKIHKKVVVVLVSTDTDSCFKFNGIVTQKIEPFPYFW